MKTREEALEQGFSFPNTYRDAPFHDKNWQLVRYSPNRKAFLWTYMREGRLNLNVNVDPEKAFFWREAYGSVIPGYHQNKGHRKPDPDNIPCFRVVNSKGELAGEFAFGGAGAQARLLEAEGITVRGRRVDLAE